MRWKFLVVALLLLWSREGLCQTALLIGSGAGSSGAKNASVFVNTSGSGLTIPSSFIGLSVETSDFVAGFYQGVSGTWTSNGGNVGNAASFVSLINLLGSNGSFRIGGGSSDAGTAPTITPTIAGNLNTFLGGLGAGWNLIYGLDLVANDTATAATTATNIATAVGNSKTVFQFGNEPSLNGFTAATYETRWNSYYTAVSGAVAGVHVGAIDDEINTSWGNAITVANALTPTLSGLSLLSQHWYSFCNLGAWPTPVPAVLLQSIYANQFGATAGGTGFFGAANNGAGFLTYASQVGSVPQRMTETNTICNNGETGMSDRMMSASWFLDMAIILASSGWSGMNVHNSWRSGAFGVYNVAVIQADHNFSAAPVFYGMYLFSKVQGQQILPSAVGGNGNVVALATKGTNGNANIIVVNNDISQSVHITPDQTAAWTTANILQIQGRNGCAEASPTVGGTAIGESGSWSGATFSISNGQSFALGPCESALVQIQ